MNENYKSPTSPKPAASRPHISYQWLCDAMRKRTEVLLYDENGQACQGRINGLRIEDGSGTCFLIKLDNREKEIFVRAS